MDSHPSFAHPLMAVTNAVPPSSLWVRCWRPPDANVLGQTMVFWRYALAAVNVFGDFWSLEECLRCSRKDEKANAALENTNEYEFSHAFLFGGQHLFHPALKD